MFHERTKHLNVQLHFIVKMVESKEVEGVKVRTEDNVIDALMKVVPSLKFPRCLKILHIEDG